MHDSFLNQYWYVVAQSHELTQSRVVARRVLEEWLACYRDADGRAVVVQDRCIHRSVRLSKGKVKQGELTCAYHGWVYGEEGKVVSIPCKVKKSQTSSLAAKTYSVIEQDGYVYVCLNKGKLTPETPFVIPRPKEGKWRKIRLQNHFDNSLTNCVENYIDVPHTAYVHHGIFRKPSRQEMTALVERKKDHLRVVYQGESHNLGSFSWLLNPKKEPIGHEDHFYAPNITSVHYHLPSGYSYYITSQSVPMGKMETYVYTDISYYLGPWTRLAKWGVRRQAQKVIDQDIVILNEQGKVIKKYGESFCMTPADVIHQFTAEIITSLEKNGDISALKDQSREVRFTV